MEDLGNIASDVKVDGVPVAKLDVKQSVIPGSGSLEYKINSLTSLDLPRRYLLSQYRLTPMKQIKFQQQELR